VLRYFPFARNYDAAESHLFAWTSLISALILFLSNSENEISKHIDVKVFFTFSGDSLFKITSLQIKDLGNVAKSGS
jgi:hypothetical protein